MRLGQITERGARECTGSAVPDRANPTPEQDQTAGWRHPYFPEGLPYDTTGSGIGSDPATSSAVQVRALKARVEYVEGILRKIREQIAKLEAAGEEPA
jgi:hypothetical protein